MYRLAFASLFPLVVSLVACGTAGISEEGVRKSERFYQAAYIAWFEEHNNLEAIRHLTRAVESNPDNDEAHYLLGTIRLGRGELEEAEKHLREALRLRGKDRPSSRAEALNSLGVLLVTTKRYDEAIPLLEEASKEVLNREPWLAMGNLGWAYIEMSQFDKAIEILRRSLFDQPKFCVGKFRLGQAYYGKNDYSKALASLTDAVTIEEGGCSKMQEAYQLMGMIHLRMKNEEEASKAFSKCAELKPVSDIGIECEQALEAL